MSEPYTYQDGLGKWVVWDGQQKHRGFETEEEAAQFLKELERMSSKSAMQEWADNVRALATQAEKLIDGTAPGKRLRVANGLDAEIDDTEPDDLVEGSDMTGARAKELREMYDALEVWLLTPLWQGGPAPIQVISRRE